MENQEKGVSVSEIFKVIFRRVWWVIGITAAFMLIFVLIIQLWYNRENQTYSLTYTIDFPGLQNNVYPDGTPFRYSSVVSEETLKTIVEGDSELAGTDVETMVYEDDIQLVFTSVSAENSQSGVAESYYVLTVGAKYFADSEHAVAFLRAVAEYPVTRAQQIAADIAADGYLIIFDEATTFEAKIGALASQRDYILSKYDEMISALSGEYTLNGRTLTDYRAAAAAAFQSSDEVYLNSLLATGHYVLNHEQFSANAQAQINDLEKQIDDNLARIDALVEQRDNATNSGYLESFNTQIANLTVANVNLQLQIEDIQASLDWINSPDRDNDIASFTARLNAYRSALLSATETFRTVYSDYFANMSDVTYSSNKIYAEGGINIILAAVIGAVIGFVLVSIAICIIDLPSYIRSRDRKAAAEGEDENSTTDE